MTGAIYHDSLTAWGHINSTPFEVGMAFHVTAAVNVTGLQWLRYTAGTGVAPEIVRLWRASDTTELGRLTSVPDDGSPGWQGANLATPITLATGEVYIVSAYYPGSAGQPSRSDIASTPDVPLVVESSYRRYRAGSAGFPTNADTGSAIGADVLLTALPPPPVPATSEDFGKWLSTSAEVNEHESDGLPWRTDANVTDIKTLATGSSGFVASKDQQNEWAFGLGALAHGYFGLIKSLIDGIKTETDHLPAFIAAVTSVMLDHYTADIDNILGLIDDVLAGLSAQSVSLSGTGGSALGALSGRSAFPATGWSMSAEESFTDNIAFNEPADAYVVNITSYQPTQPADSTAAGLWLPRLGWWCVLNGSLASQRGFVEFEEQLLTDQGRRMPACAIQLKPGTMATVQAWLLA